MFVLHLPDLRANQNRFFSFYAELYLHSLAKDQTVTRPAKMKHFQLIALFDRTPFFHFSCTRHEETSDKPIDIVGCIYAPGMKINPNICPKFIFSIFFLRLC